MKKTLPSWHRHANARLVERITLVRGDLTQQDGIDALVSTIPADLDCTGGVNAALIKAAGYELDDFILENVFKPKPGDVFAVPGFDLSVEHVLFVVTPGGRSDFDRMDRDVVRCYRGAIRAAQEMGLKRIAFPALGTGHTGIPVQRAVRLGVQGIMDRLLGELDEVRIVCNRDETYAAFKERLSVASSQ